MDTRDYQSVGAALEQRPNETLIDAAARCVAERSGRVDVAAIVLRLDSDEGFELYEQAARNSFYAGGAGLSTLNEAARAAERTGATVLGGAAGKAEPQTPP